MSMPLVTGVLVTLLAISLVLNIVYLKRRQTVDPSEDPADDSQNASWTDLEAATRQMSGQLHLQSIEQASLFVAINQQFIYSVVDNHARILEVNENFCRISGYSREELIGQNHRIVNSGFHDRAFWNDMWRTLRAGKAWRGEVCNRAKNGDLYWVDSVMAPIIQDDGRIERYISLRADITLKKQAGANLETTNSLLMNVLAASTEFSIIATDTEGTITLFNSGAQKLLGYTSTELVGRFTPGLFHCPEEIGQRAHELSELTGEVIDGFETFVHQARSLGTEAREWTYIRKDGARVPVSLTVSVIRDVAGNISGYLGIAKDVSEQREVEKALRSAKEAADQANRAKSQFLANMSHEIRTPLNALIGMTYLLNRSSLSAEQKNQVNAMQGAGNTLLNLINDVLDISKIEAGELLIDQQPFALQPLFDDLDVMFRQQANLRNINLVMPSGRGVFQQPLIGDPSRIQQILINLLNNALKFTSQGCIELTTHYLKQGSEQITLQIGVRDTGIGISEHTQKNLFRPFVQADLSTSRLYGGTGLGLTISRRLAEQMGGSLQLESQPGVGSHFKLELPLKLAELVSQHNNAIPGIISEALQLLIVDDDPAYLLLIGTLCHQLGWQHELAEGGDAALEKIRQRIQQGTPYDCLLIDWNMPGLDGVKTLQALAEDFASTRPGVIVMTAGDVEALRAIHPPHSHEHILGKPFDVSSLFSAVTNTMVRMHKPQKCPMTADSLQDGAYQWLSGSRVMVVDDSEINCDVCRQILELQGAEVTTALDGESAIRHLQNGTPCDVVLMDLQMPSLDGFETTRRLREDPALKSLPIIALTANVLVTARRRAEEVGMNGFLTKPIKPLELIKTLRETIDTHSRTVNTVYTATGLSGAADRSCVDQPTAATGPTLAQADDFPVLQGIDPDFAHQVFGRNRSNFLRLIGQFLNEYRDIADEFQLSRDAEDSTGLQRTLHRLRGNALNLGAHHMAETVKHVETALADQTGLEQVFFDRFLEDFTALRTSFDTSCPD